jgi:hypothetical protein
VPSIFHHLHHFSFHPSSDPTTFSFCGDGGAIPTTLTMLLNNKCTLFGAILWICVVCHRCLGFSSPRCYHRTLITSTTVLSAAKRGDDDVGGVTTSTRREWMRATASTLIATTSSIVFLANPKPEQAMAAVESKDIIWKTGRAPIIPGKTPSSDKGDVKGTKKDPNFLRSVSDCKSKCENSYDSDGLARSASECLQACQDICCTTYEQCTFTIVR